MVDGSQRPFPAEDERLRVLFEQSPVAILFADRAGRVVTANPAACEFLGRSLDQLIGMGAADLVPVEDLDALDELLAAARAGRTDRVRGEIRYLRPNSTTVWGDATMHQIRDTGGELRYWQIVVVDITEQKRALDAQVRLSDVLLDSAPDAIVCCDADGTIKVVNAQAERLFGYTRQELLGQPVELLVPDSAREAHRVHREDYVTEPVARPMGRGTELSGRRKDGTEFLAEISLSGIDTDDGLLVAVAVRDGTERRRAAIVASSSDSLTSRTLAGVVTSWNPGAERLYGYAAHEALGEDMARMLPPDRVEEDRRAMARVARGETVVISDTTRRRRDGRLVRVALTMAPMRDDSGTVIGVSGTARDITAVAEAEDARRAADAQVRLILDNAPIVLFAIDATGIMTLYQAGGSLGDLGDLHDPNVGRSIFEVYADRPEALERVRRALAGEEIAEEVITNDRVLDVRFKPILGASGQVAGITGVAVDVTERARAQQAQEAMEARLRQSERLESLGMLAGGIAHDFNNLLGVILNYTDFAMEELEDAALARADLDAVRGAAERAAKLVRQLLIFGRRDGSSAEVLDLNEVVLDVQSLLSRTLGEHVHLIVHTADSLPAAIRFDRGRIEQVLVNLAVNSRDAMPDGGTLTIETRAVHLDEDYAREHPGVRPGRYLQLSVSDTGTGMGPEVLAHALEPFFTTKGPGVGTGLGLATVYGIVTEAGGSLSLYSEVGMGTTVRIYLPAVPDPVAAEERAAAAQAAAGHGERILVVEDEAAMREVTCRILSRSGYTVVEADGPEEALRLAADHQLDLLLTDVVMPSMSGREVADLIRQRTPELPVLYMSGYSQGVLGPQHLDGDAALIQKPFDQHTLLSSVMAALSATRH